MSVAPVTAAPGALRDAGERHLQRHFAAPGHPAAVPMAAVLRAGLEAAAAYLERP